MNASGHLLRESCLPVGREAGRWRWELPRHGTRAWRGGDRAAVTVLRGSIWLTEEDGGGDRFLKAGDTMILWRPGRVVAQALEDAVVELRQES